MREDKANRIYLEHGKPIRFGEELTIDMTIVKLGRSSVTYSFDFTHDGEPIARGQVTAVFCRFKDGRPQARDMPAELRAKLETAD